jgi:hypothetical protein
MSKKTKPKSVEKSAEKKKQKVDIRVDAAPFVDKFSEFEFERNRFLQLFNDSSFCFFNVIPRLIRSESCTTSEGAVLVTLKPSDCFLNLLSAFRAFNGDFKVVERKGHNSSV